MSQNPTNPHRAKQTRLKLISGKEKVLMEKITDLLSELPADTTCGRQHGILSTAPQESWEDRLALLVSQFQTLEKNAWRRTANCVLMLYISCVKAALEDILALSVFGTPSWLPCCLCVQQNKSSTKYLSVPAWKLKYWRLIYCFLREMWRLCAAWRDCAVGDCLREAWRARAVMLWRRNNALKPEWWRSWMVKAVCTIRDCESF